MIDLLPMTHDFRLKTALSALVAAWTLALAVPAEAQWRRLDSPNFVVIGDTSTSRLRDVALEFEGFRETLARVLVPRVTASAVPTVVYVFPEQSAIEPFRPRYNGKPVDIGGLTLQGRDINIMAVIDDDRPGRLKSIFHEYTHLLVANTEQAIPLWLHEGLAEYYSTYESIKGGKEATIGKVIEEHLGELNQTTLIPLDDLLSMKESSPLYNEGSRRSVFYAQTWALTHLLLLGEPNRQSKFNQYVNRVATGTSALDAWHETFSGDDVQKALSEYIRRLEYKNFKFTFADSITKVPTTTANVSQADAQTFQAILLAGLREYEAATARLAQLKKLDPSNPMQAVVAARMARAQGFAVDAATLRSTPTPADWFFAYLAGVGVADAAAEQASITTDDLETARRLLTASWAGRQPTLNGTARLAEMELRHQGGPNKETVVAFAGARERATHRYEYAMLYAQILVAQSDYAQAQTVVAPFIAGAYPANVRSHARSLMGYIVNAQAQKTRGATPPPFPGAPPPPGTAGSSTNRSQPIYRELKEGEQRLDGVLTDIECVQGKGITFHVKVGEQDVLVTSPTFNDVEFITYRDDLRGNISCGPRPTPMAVYVTWKKGADPASKIAVAIEFLPKTGPVYLLIPASPLRMMSILVCGFTDCRPCTTRNRPSLRPGARVERAPHGKLFTRKGRRIVG